MNIRVILFCLAVMTMMIATESAYAHAKNELRKKAAGGECALTEDELDETLGGLEELGLLVKQMESLLKDAVRRRL